MLALATVNNGRKTLVINKNIQRLAAVRPCDVFPHTPAAGMLMSSVLFPSPRLHSLPHLPPLHLPLLGVPGHYPFLPHTLVHISLKSRPHLIYALPHTPPSTPHLGPRPFPPRPSPTPQPKSSPKCPAVDTCGAMTHVLRVTSVMISETSAQVCS